jgi:hypothetical protein
MDFRWVVAIALWTLLSGPIFAPAPGSSARTRTEVARHAETVSHTAAAAPRR